MTASSITHHVNSSVVRRQREAILPLSWHLSDHSWTTTSNSTILCARNVLINFSKSGEGHQSAQGLEALPYKKCWEIQPGEETPSMRLLLAACWYLWGGYQKDGAWLFTEVVHGMRMRDNSYKLPRGYCIEYQGEKSS